MEENSKKTTKKTAKKRTSKKTEIVSIDENVKSLVEDFFQKKENGEFDKKDEVETISVGVQDTVQTITIDDVVEEKVSIIDENEKRRRWLMGFR